LRFSNALSRSFLQQQKRIFWRRGNLFLHSGRSGFALDASRVRSAIGKY
jgi:hypothetical protein